MLMFTRRSALLSGAAAAAGSVMAQSPARRRILSARFSLPNISAALLPRDKWHPWPTLADRAAWTGLPADTRSKLVAGGETVLKQPWAVLPATLFLEFARNGNRSRFEREIRTRRERLTALVLAECVEGKGRFLDEIGNGIWLQCEETFWGYPAHLSLQKDGPGLPEVTEPVIDLFAAEASALLAWTDYLLGASLDKVHPKVRTRLHHEVIRRVQTPFLARNDFWWMGLEANRAMNNWTPWIVSNCLASTLLIEADPKLRAEVAEKSVRCLDRFLDSYHDDGGCDEGPGYWGHAGGSLFDNLEMLHSASDGKLNGFDVPLVAEMGRYMYRVQIADDWFVNFADASARTVPDWTLLYRFGRRINDPKLQAMGADVWRRHPETVGTNLWRVLPSLFGVDDLRKTPPAQALPRESWLSGIQVLTARSQEGSAKGLFLAAQGGHNAESHNHNDVGNFMVFVDGKPAIIDVGVETYSAKTFSPKRYEIWTMQSGYHNCPTVNGVMQGAGRQFEATSVAFSGGSTTELALDLGKAYPAQAGIESWRRTLRLDRGRNAVEVSDAWALRQAGGELAFTLMTTCDVQVAGNEVLLAGRARVRLEGPPVQIAVEEVRTEDARLKPVWGDVIRRILIRAAGVPQKGTLRTVITSAVS